MFLFYCHFQYDHLLLPQQHLDLLLLSPILLFQSTLDIFLLLLLPHLYILDQSTLKILLLSTSNLRGCPGQLTQDDSLSETCCSDDPHFILSDLRHQIAERPVQDR